MNRFQIRSWIDRQIDRQIISIQYSLQNIGKYNIEFSTEQQVRTKCSLQNNRQVYSALFRTIGKYKVFSTEQQTSFIVFFTEQQVSTQCSLQHNQVSTQCLLQNKRLVYSLLYNRTKGKYIVFSAEQQVSIQCSLQNNRKVHSVLYRTIGKYKVFSTEEQASLQCSLPAGKFLLRSEF